MKILYGVVGEGMGHAIRSSVILEHLTARGHEVRIAVSGRAAKFLMEKHPGAVTEITGLVMEYEENTVKKLRTFLSNLKAVRDIPDNLRSYLKMRREFEPDVVISDFESWSYFFARGSNIPVISVDNMQIIARCYHEAEVLGDELGAFLLAKSFVKAKLPLANAYIITTFFYPKLEKDRTSLHPPILRKSIIDAKKRANYGDHVLVYQSSTSHEGLLASLEKLNDVEFKVYGLARNLRAPETKGNITLCPFSEDGFIEDLATARAVVSGGGFTLLGEALTLKKPVLSVPLSGQFEQILNARYLRHLEYGDTADEINAENLRAFLNNELRYRERLEGFEHDDNVGVLARIDEALESAIEEGPRLA